MRNAIHSCIFASLVAILANLNGAPLGAAPPTIATPQEFQLQEGFTIELVAGPPLVEQPMHAWFDEQGRLLVADSLGINPTGELLTSNAGQVIRLLEDTDGDGRFDKTTTLVDRLAFPEGVLWHQGAVFTASPPSLWRIDQAGNPNSERRTELVTGWKGTGIADDLHGPSLGPDGRIYWACGRFPHEIRKPGGPVLANGRAPVLLRCRPDGTDVEILCGLQGNAVKHAFSEEGEIFTSGTWSKGSQGRDDVVLHCLEGGNYPQLDGDFYSPEFKHTPELLPVMISFGPASAAGIMRYRSDVLGPEYRDNLLVALFNMRKLTRHVLARDGGTFRATSQDFLTSTNADFRPSDVIEDADGSLLVINTGTWSNACRAFRAGGQARAQGSIYRIRRTGAKVPIDPRGLRVDWAGLAPRELAGLLDDPRFAVRDRAVGRLVAAANGSVGELTSALADAGRSLTARRAAIWTLTQIGTPEALAAVRTALADAHSSLRLTACISAGLNRDVAAVPALVGLLPDERLEIRREAATALGRITAAEAVPALLKAASTAKDAFVEHALIYALIRIGDRQQTIQGLADASPAVRRAALVALDQMEGGDLTREQIVPQVNADDPALQKAALQIIERHRPWHGELLQLVQSWLAERPLAAEHQGELRGALLALAANPQLQKLVTQALADPSAPAEVRLLLLEFITQAPVTPLPDDWQRQLRRLLDDADDRVARAAIAALAAGRVAQFDGRLVELAGDSRRSSELRLAAAAAAAPRMAHVDAPLFAFLLSRLDPDAPPLERLAAASCLGGLALDDRQLAELTPAVAKAGAIELPHLASAYQRCHDGEVGLKLIAALERSPGRPALTLDKLTALVASFPPQVGQAAQPLVDKLAAPQAEMQRKLTDRAGALEGGTPDRGRQVFFGKKAACFACHTASGEGGQVGPDLSKIGAIRSSRDLLVAVLFPSASFARGFEPYTIVSQDGRTFSGVIRRETSDSLELVTADRSTVRVPRSQIEELVPGKVSVMPEGLDNQLSPDELRDLIAYLLSLK